MYLAAWVVLACSVYNRVYFISINVLAWVPNTQTNKQHLNIQLRVWFVVRDIKQNYNFKEHQDGSI